MVPILHPCRRPSPRASQHRDQECIQAGPNPAITVRLGKGRHKDKPNLGKGRHYTCNMLSYSPTGASLKAI